jgi:hypothetical protein
MPDSRAHLLRTCGGWLLLAAVFFCPWAFGGKPVWAIHSTEILTACAALVWGLGCGIEMRLPRIPSLLLLTLLALLVIGWGMALNAHGVYEWQRGAIDPVVSPFPDAPGAVDDAVAIDAMLRATAVITTVAMACDLCSDSRWRRRALWTLAAAGASISILGLLARAGFFPWFAEQMPDVQGLTFATFDYHGNAGAFLNLCFCAAAGLVMTHWTNPWLAARRAAIAMATLIAAGLCVNFSRAAQVVFGCTLLVMFAGVWFAGRRDRSGSPARFASLALPVIIILLLGGALGGRAVLRRWESVRQPLALHGSRATADRISLHMAQGAGWLGFGPGSYKVLLPMQPDISTLYSEWIVTWYIPGTEVSMWCNAHNDYLQTWIEWGLLGAACWGVVLAGGLVGCSRSTVKKRLDTPDSGRTSDDERTSHGDRALYFAAALGVAGVLAHAVVDFPFQILSIQLAAALLLAIGWSCRWSEHCAANGQATDRPAA